MRRFWTIGLTLVLVVVSLLQTGMAAAEDTESVTISITALDCRGRQPSRSEHLFSGKRCSVPHRVPHVRPESDLFSSHRS